MNLNKHYDLKGKHALLSPSSSAWLRYDDDKLITFVGRSDAAKRGTDIHAWACESIRLGIRQSRSKKALYAYVNDALTLNMIPEQSLYYSDNCFGTVDAIGFDGRLLRIHDLKTGTSMTYEDNSKDMEQLIVYAALFCLEYFVDPTKIGIELRVYQYEEAVIFVPSPEEVLEVMSIIEHHDKMICQIKSK